MIIRFQLLDADYFLNDNKPVLRLFGRTKEGDPVCILYDKMKPYFYVKCTDAKKLAVIKDYMTDVEEVERFPAIGYSRRPEKLYKITIRNPQDTPKVREKLVSEKAVEEIFEADILFKYRFMIDHGLYGMQWVEAECAAERTRVSKVPAYKAETIRPLELAENTPLSYMAFDIECVSDGQGAPEARKDPIIMISVAFNKGYNGSKSVVLVSKQLSADGIRGFASEKEMLEEFLRIIEKYDPDVLTGYNINNYDFPYIIERLRSNKIPANFGRADKTSFMRTAGMTQEFVITGRVVIDPYQVLKRDPWVKFARYDLNSIARIMLNDEKHSVEYSEMKGLWNGNREGVIRLAEYARKDSDLALRLVVDKGMLDKFVELAKISGLLLQDAMGGQTRRVEMMALHEFRKKNFVMPLAPSKAEIIKRNKERDTQGLKGAIVLEPKKGLHTDGCILVLDFKSLYPSIMRTYNVSPDTLTAEGPESHQSPSGAYFIDTKLHEGILPHVLSRLVEARANTKKAMRAVLGEEARILNAKQLAIKDMSNSFYGYTGYIRARLYTIDVANTITAYGRKNIEKTRKFVEENFDVEVVYGDTDSVFVQTKTTDLDEAREIGERIAKSVTDQLPGYLELEFEKIYKTFLILTKKRYAGWRFDKTDAGWQDRMEMRGIETVRRDWCPIVSELMLDVLNTILKEGDLAKAKDLVRKTLDDLKQGRIPLSKLTIVKGITKSLDGYEGMLPHIEAARKMAARNPQDAPGVGDRIGYVIIKGDQLLSKRAEDPKYVEEHKIALDPDYYIFPPIERIFNAVGIQRSEVFGGGRQTGLAAFGKKDGSKTLPGWEEFVCAKCKQSHRRMPLNGSCECGGTLLISYHGSAGAKVSIEK